MSAEEQNKLELGEPGTGVAKRKKDSPTTKVTAIILVIAALCVAGYQIYMNVYNLPFDPAAVRRDGNRLYVAAFGEVGEDAIRVVKSNIEREFPELGEIKIVSIPIPESARKDLGPGTIQPLSADKLLETMAASANEFPDLLKMMGVTEEPLYFEEAGPERDIWGLTDAIGGNFGVVSTTLKRKDIEDEGYERGTERYNYYFDLSLGKSTLHEFGHLLGLHHCKGGIGCPMELSSPLKALEKRGNVLCSRHREQLMKLYEEWGIK